MYDVRIVLSCSDRSGILSRIIREINLFGLTYQGHKLDELATGKRITVNASGELNCTRDALEELFAGLPEVHSIDRLLITRNGDEVTQFKTGAPDVHIAATERLTPAIVLAAEQRLSDVLGPVASVIVGAAADQCRNAGELYRHIAQELDDERERAEFLAVLDGGE